MKLKETADRSNLSNFGYTYISDLDSFYKVFLSINPDKLFAEYRTKNKIGVIINSNGDIVIKKKKKNTDWVEKNNYYFAVEDLVNCGYVEV